MKNSTLFNLLLTNTTTKKLIELNYLKKITVSKKNGEILKLPSNIHSYSTSELAGEYKVEIGLRIAVLFGSMVIRKNK
jgi:hypothetical protein